MAHITNFQSVRVGSEFPYTLDIEPICGHELEGIVAKFWSIPRTPRGHYGVERAELRYRDGVFGLFLFRYEDQEPSEWWRDSEIVWRLEE